MSLPLAVGRRRPWWAPWRSLDLDGRAVLAALTPLFASAADRSASSEDDPVAALTRLVTSGRPGDAEELAWQGRRLSSQWVVYAGDRGVREVDADIRDDAPGGPPDEFAAELRPLVAALRELALATGARFYADTGDVTDRPVDAIVEMIC